MKPVAPVSCTASLPFWEDAMRFVLKKTRTNIPLFSDGFPAASSEGNIYPKTPNVDWTTSFWPGMLYLCWQYSHENVFLDTAHALIPSFQERIEGRRDTQTHDLGFLYILSCKADWMCTGNVVSKAIALEAADALMERYVPKAGILQAWGGMNDPSQQGRMIIDCLMNIPLLFWASKETGNPTYREAAAKHLKNTQTYIIRPNDTTYHTYYFDVESGEAKYGKTAQGYGDDSCWARGQAWGIYGLGLNYTYTHDSSLLTDAMRLAEYFLARLPEDFVSYWDLVFTDGDEQRDSSAAAIAACGLLQLSSLLPPSNTRRQKYERYALAIMQHLTQAYTSRNLPQANGILLHGVYAKPANKGVDECTVWGDYFYTEALVRILKQPELFW